MYVTNESIPADLPELAAAPAEVTRPVAPTGVDRVALVRGIGKAAEILAAVTSPAARADIRQFVGGWLKGVYGHARQVRAEVAVETIIRAVGAGVVATARHISEAIEAAAQKAGTDTTDGN